jgi:lipid-binding SYLF domain-containing protein
MVPALTCSSWRFRFGLSVAFVCLWLGPIRAQKIDKTKLDTAARRASKAAKVLTDVSALPAGETIPKELLERARAIAVFPEVDKVNMLVQKFMKGFGVMSRRVPSGWSTPAFYGFAVIDKGWTSVKGDRPGVIILFMDDDILKRFEKDHSQLAGEAGPVGELTPEKENKIRAASMIIYALSDGKLRGISVEDDSTTQSGINADNHINEAVFGLKAREVLSGKTPVGPPVPPAVTEFQNVLTSLSKQ